MATVSFTLRDTDSVGSVYGTNNRGFAEHGSLFATIDGVSVQFFATASRIRQLAADLEKAAFALEDQIKLQNAKWAAADKAATAPKE